MSVKDLNKTIIVSDALTGEVIGTVDRGLYDDNVILIMLSNILEKDLLVEHGLILKHGYKN